MELTSRFNYIDTGYFDSVQSDWIHKKKTTTPPRVCLNYEIELYLSKSGTTFINEVKYDIEQYSLIVCKPGDVRYSVNPFKCYYLYISAEDGIIKDILDSLPPQMQAFNAKIFLDRFFSLLKYPAKRNEEQPYAELRIVSHVHEIVFRLAENRDFYEKQKFVNVNVSKAITEAKRFIMKNYNRNIQLKDVANHVFLSPNYFHKLFTQVTGITPHQYIINQKINAAKKMLLESDATITDIIINCGFSSQSYFNAIFKREVKITPNDYRKSMNRYYKT
ncbi:MAG: AraC family transcriptional regulator [Candidatus Borkfalkiaceae bacterium]|nr:AraC family transcriptional regulator [Christensenellaceae bacterium]